MKITSTEPSLKKPRQQLDHHRAISKRAVFPEALKWQAAALLNDFSANAIQQALGLSLSSLDRWKKALTNDVSTTANNERIVCDDAGAFGFSLLSPACRLSPKISATSSWVAISASAIYNQFKAVALVCELG